LNGREPLGKNTRHDGVVRVEDWLGNIAAHLLLRVVC
jgi:hypothetical protein